MSLAAPGSFQLASPSKSSMACLAPNVGEVQWSYKSLWRLKPSMSQSDVILRLVEVFRSEGFVTSYNPQYGGSLYAKSNRKQEWFQAGTTGGRQVYVGGASGCGFL
jgi:hypothetical protein